eukprot:scaffold326693_cov21-Prasinocladus_malaysianus.AAC.2
MGSGVDSDDVCQSTATQVVTMPPWSSLPKHTHCSRLQARDGNPMGGGLLGNGFACHQGQSRVHVRQLFMPAAVHFALSYDVMVKKESPGRARLLSGIYFVHHPSLPGASLILGTSTSGLSRA